MLKLFFERFEEDLKMEKGIITKLRNYESVCGNYNFTLDSKKIKKME